MSTSGGPKIVTNGLAFAVDATDVFSFRGENTTNLMPTITSWGVYVTSPTNVTVFDFPGNIGLGKVVKQSIGSSVVGGGGNYGGFYRAGVSSLVTSGDTVTVSFSVRSLSGNIACRLSNQNGAGDESNLSFSFTATSSWTRVSNTATLNLSKDQFYIWNANVASGTWQIADFQLEKKSYATRYTESSRGTTTATGGGWADLAGSGNDGELLNGVREGETFLTFDGVNDYVATNNVTLSYPTGYAVEVVMKYNTLSGTQGLFSYNGGGNYMNFYKDSTTMRWEVGGSQALYSSTQLSAGRWYHFTGVYSGTTAYFYINGNLDISGNLTSSTSTTGPIVIGQYAGYTNGNIALVRVYTKPLTAAEVAQNFNTTRGRFGI